MEHACAGGHSDEKEESDSWIHSVGDGAEESDFALGTNESENQTQKIELCSFTRQEWKP